jgi:hypothetical protein
MYGGGAEPGGAADVAGGAADPAGSGGKGPFGPLEADAAADPAGADWGSA